MKGFGWLLLALPVLGQNPLTDAVNARYQIAKQNLMESAAAMPEDQYGFRLTPAQRPFGEWIDHTADGNYNYCAAIRGETPPAVPKSGPQSKAAVEQRLKDSFAYCDETLKSVTDAKALAETTVGGKAAYPVNSMVGLVGFLNEHYGNLVGYMRSKGITPPSTARGQKKK